MDIDDINFSYMNMDSALILDNRKVTKSDYLDMQHSFVEELNVENMDSAPVLDTAKVTEFDFLDMPHSSIVQELNIEPYVGMEFDSQKKVEEFYKLFAKVNKIISFLYVVGNMNTR